MALSTLAIAGVPGGLCLMACPGRNHRVVGKPPLRQRIVGDVREALNSGVAGFVTLVESTEIQALGITQLPSILRDFGLWWHHLPIRDRDVPDAGFEHSWETRGRWIREQLRGGSSIALHCHAGLGRTGLVAARLLVEFGADPKVALSSVRRARPGAVETARQEDYVLGLIPGEPKIIRR